MNSHSKEQSQPRGSSYSKFETPSKFSLPPFRTKTAKYTDETGDPELEEPDYEASKPEAPESLRIPGMQCKICEADMIVGPSNHNFKGDPKAESFFCSEGCGDMVQQPSMSKDGTIVQKLLRDKSC
ncbi:hypothetical protein ABW19_dt0207312 [Dactylella cylindrospora]|nr:hypothetical protein ABW19_dt0207312 [Dactylella cylindrospora]